ncbi:DUF397 domain-containing protein [Streptomyces orinoci]|uniref:DUF397 domain-containing protein n=1 Tax=Streptomyces orinoci TaxID=67339 RepID=A0ABV3JVC4_STRON
MTGISWKKSPFSTDGNDCIELSRNGGTAFLRESADPEVVLRIGLRALRALFGSIGAGRDSSTPLCDVPHRSEFCA